MKPGVYRRWAGLQLPQKRKADSSFCRHQAVEISMHFCDLTFLFFNEIYRAITTRQVHNGRSQLDSAICWRDLSRVGAVHIVTRPATPSPRRRETEDARRS